MTDIVDYIIKRAILLIVIVQESSHKGKDLMISMKISGGQMSTNSQPS